MLLNTNVFCSFAALHFTSVVDRFMSVVQVDKVCLSHHICMAWL